MTSLNNVANEIVFSYKGILAADESPGTMGKRFESVSLTMNNEAETRRIYRNALFDASGLGQYIGGVILHEETLEQCNDDELPIPSVLAQEAIHAGVKVDKGAKPLCLHNTVDKVTHGLDGLEERCERFRMLGARFTKWRAVLTVDTNCYALRENARVLARFAAISQANDMVPIVEPEVLMDGDHDIEKSRKVTRRAIRMTFDELDKAGVDFSGVLLKPNMVLPGYDSTENVSDTAIAHKTVSALMDSVPASVPGVVFLSGGQTPEQSTSRLSAINAVGSICPWRLSFSFGRALQAPSLKAFSVGDFEGVAVQLLKRAKLNSVATSATYTAAMELDN